MELMTVVCSDGKDILDVVVTPYRKEMEHEAIKRYAADVLAERWNEPRPKDEQTETGEAIYKCLTLTLHHSVVNSVVEIDKAAKVMTGMAAASILLIKGRAPLVSFMPELDRQHAELLKNLP